MEGLGYKETCAGIRPEDAFDITCRAFGRMLAMNKALVMLDSFGNQVEQQDLDVSATVGSTGSLMLVCSGGGGDCRGNLADCRPMGGFGRWISLAFLALPENNTLKLLVMAHNRFGEDGMLTLAHVQPQARYVVLRRQRYILSQGYPSSFSIPPKLEGVSMEPKQGSLTMSSHGQGSELCLLA